MSGGGTLPSLIQRRTVFVVTPIFLVKSVRQMISSSLVSMDFPFCGLNGDADIS